jgi:hypothetical protein
LIFGGKFPIRYLFHEIWVSLIFLLVDLRNMYIFKHYFSKVITNSWFICNFFNFDFFFQVKYIFFKVFTNEYVLCSIKINLCFDYLLGVIPLNNFPYHFMLNKQKLSFYTGLKIYIFLKSTNIRLQGRRATVMIWMHKIGQAYIFIRLQTWTLSRSYTHLHDLF